MKPLSLKGSFLWCVPERVIMLTSNAYRIQRKKTKNQPLSPKGWFFLLKGGNYFKKKMVDVWEHLE
ncbi:hypothetical protein OEA_30405 (plasmid) [Priestia megaterium NCT-2]|nr:hypothetical protein OEA_30405 [Priestia megaterium NCT-2]